MMSPFADNLEAVLNHLASDERAALERLFEVLRIPSISTLPEHIPDCRRAAEWFADQYRELGFTAELRETPGHPVVVAHLDEAGPEAPHILYYGHYDVQPAEITDGWSSAPFTPEMRDHPSGKRIVARGATDDKGQVMIWIEAFRAWKAVNGALPVRVTVLLEGEEESGSPSLEPFLRAHARELSAPDVVVASDGNMWNIDTASVTTRLRGNIYAELTLRAGNNDLHSGLFGGVARNAINLMVEFLAKIRDEDGRILLPGFYDSVPEVPETLLESWKALDFDEAQLLKDFGLTTPAGEKDRIAVERLWSRPTADIHGIWGGYIAAGRKTVIPCEAKAKISFRMPPGQNIQAAMASLETFAKEAAPADARITIEWLGTQPGLEIDSETVWMQALQQALGAEYGKPAALTGCGGSLPVVGLFKEILGLETLLFSFGLEDDNPHGPDEKFDLICYRRGARAHARLVAELAGLRRDLA